MESAVNRYLTQRGSLNRYHHPGRLERIPTAQAGARIDEEHEE